MGDPILAMRMRDAIAALVWLRSRPEVDPEQIILMGAGLGGVVALHVAACDHGVAGVIAWDGLSSFRSLLGAECYPWPADAFLPRVLRRYDLPELVAALSCPVRLFALRNGVRVGCCTCRPTGRKSRVSGLSAVPCTSCAFCAFLRLFFNAGPPFQDVNSIKAAEQGLFGRIYH